MYFLSRGEKTDKLTSKLAEVSNYYTHSSVHSKLLDGFPSCFGILLQFVYSTIICSVKVDLLDKMTFGMPCTEHAQNANTN